MIKPGLDEGGGTSSIRNLRTRASIWGHSSGQLLREVGRVDAGRVERAGVLAAGVLAAGDDGPQWRGGHSVEAPEQRTPSWKSPRGVWRPPGLRKAAVFARRAGGREHWAWVLKGCVFPPLRGARGPGLGGPAVGVCRGWCSQTESLLFLIGSSCGLLTLEADRKPGALMVSEVTPDGFLPPRPC